MGSPISRPVRNISKRSKKLHRSADDVYECDISRSSNTLGGGGESVVNLQDRICRKSSKPSKGRSESDIYLQDNKYHATSLYATLQTDGTSNPVYMNMGKFTLDGTSNTVAFESNEVQSADSCLKRSETSPQTTNDNYYTDPHMAPSRPNFQKRSSISSIYVRLPPLPESAEAEMEKLRERNCQETTVEYGTIVGKNRISEYMTTTCFERPDPMLNSHDYTLINQPINTSITANDSETTGEDECASEDVEIQENVGNDDLVPSEVTLQSRDVGEYKEVEDENSHGMVSTDPGCDAATRHMSIQAKKSTDCDYELDPGKYGHRRCVSYKKINRLKTPVANLHPSARQPLKRHRPTTNVSEPPPLQPLPHQPAQPLQNQLLQTSQRPPVVPNALLSTYEMPVHDNQVQYRVGLGSELRVPGMTVSVPDHIDSGSSHVELRWSSNPDEFPVLSVDQRPLRNVLHCLPHGSTFTSPVVISLDLPVNRGQIEVFYSPTDVGQTPIWTKLRAVAGSMGNSRFTDGQTPHANKVLLSTNGRKAVLVLRHFCSFVLVENGSVVHPRKAEVAIFLQTKIKGHESWLAILKVVVGCDKNKMHRRQKSLQVDGYRVIEKTGLLLYNTESGSGVEVGIRDVEWMVGCMQKQSKTRMIHGLDCLWSGMEATSQFWMTSKGSKQNEEQLTLTVYVHQEGHLEKPIGIYCDMTNDLRTPSKSRRTVVATRSSPAAPLQAPVNLHYEIYATNPSSDSDLNLVPDDLSSRRKDDVISDSDRDYELNYCATGKSDSYEDVSDRKTPDKRFSHYVENMENVGVYENDPVSSKAKSMNRFEYSSDDENRMTATVGGNFITQPDLEWMLAG